MAPGTLDPICALRRVEVVDLSSNVLSGTISDAIGSMTTLQQLFLSDNKLIGKWCGRHLPGCFMVLLLATAVWIYLSIGSPVAVVVYCAGSVPDAISSLRELSVLCLANNNLTGVLPRGLAALSKLSVLAVQGNRLKGT